MAFTVQEAINQAVDLLAQRDDVNEQLKALKEAAGNNNLNPKALMAAATAIHKDKLDTLEEYTDEVSDIISNWRHIK